MTNPNLTYIQAIIDRSGSMQSIRSDAEGGFDAFIAEQRKLPGECLVSLARFDDKYEVGYQDLPLAEVPPLEIIPRGTTAMLDAIGRTVNELGARLAALSEDRRPATVVVAIVTDGLENASREFSYPVVRQMITTQEQTYSWTFLYLGADQDAIEQGAKMGIAADYSLSYARANSSDAYQAASGSISRLRSAMASGADGAAAKKAAAFSDEERHKSGGA